MTKTVTVDQMIATINERIKFLGVIRASLAFAMAGTLVTESETVSTKITPKRAVKAKAKRRVRARTTPVKPLILSVLGDYSSAQTVTDILHSVMLAGWETSSDSPRSVLQATLAQMVKKGVLQRVGKGYALAGTTLDTEVAA